MYKLLISLVIFTTSLTAIANTKNWSDLQSSDAYIINQKLEFSDRQRSFSINPNTRLVLKERTSLSMIKVELFKFDISAQCPSSDMTTEIQLVEVVQPNGKVITVGFDIAEDCTMEAFVEFVDLNTKSLFK